MMKMLSLIMFCAMLTVLTGCGKALLQAGAVTGIYLTKPAEGAPADTSEKTPPHQTWCYRTLGVPECFDHPQPDAGGRLISVQPGNMRPASHAAYEKMILDRADAP